MSFDVRGQEVIVVGAGRSGRAAAALLRDRGARVTLAETAASVEGAEILERSGVTLALGAHDPALFTRASLVVLSPGVPPTLDVLQAARRAGVPVIGEIELAFRWLEGRVIAITGTKGKSTTTTLTARMLHEAGLVATAGGNLGDALSGQVAATSPDALHVVEVSSFQLETTTSFHPWVAVALNLSPDHLDRHASFEEYAAAKARIFANQTADDWAIVNADDPGALSLARGARARRFDFALDAAIRSGVTVNRDVIVRRDDGRDAPLLPVASVTLPGRHLLSDVLAAAAVGCVAGVPASAMQRAVESFRGLEHALEHVDEVDGVTFVNDSKATNIASARRAIESFDRGVVAIMGGRYKGGRFEDLASVVQTHVRAIVAIGEAQGRIHDALDAVVPVHDADSMDDAVREAFALASPHGVVVLAPACSSFDMFQDYAARGRAFKAAVAELKAGA